MVAALIAWLLRRSRYAKRTALVVADLILLNFALWLAMSVRWGYLYVTPSRPIFLLLAIVPVIAVAALAYAGVYRRVTRHFGGEGAQLVAVCNSFSAVGLGLGAFLAGAEGIPRSVLLLYPLFGTLLVWGYRHLLGRLVVTAGVELPRHAASEPLNVLVYGASAEGRAIVEAIRRSPDLSAVGFVDPDPTLCRQYIDGLRVYAPQRLPHIIGSMNVKQVLLATHHASRRERFLALQALEGCPVDVRILPAVEDVAAGRVSVNDLRPVNPDDLLGRPPIPADPELMASAIAGKSVLVTGAGGSIGSELVRQVLRFAPARLVLFDIGENNLFAIDMEVRRLLQAAAAQSGQRPEVITVLGSVTNDQLVRRTLREHQIETIYHAAAFKHVPLVEHNVIAGYRNNVLGTEVLANAAESCGAQRFVLISTDKAVRPSSVMGASKRIAEMLLQARAGAASTRIAYAIVRFGNVIDSSGSVVPLFRSQIAAGGPVTVTHPDMVRYFISIPEAAALVVQAGAMASGGEVFALDMGEPIRILDLARLMIQLSGRQVRDAEHPEGEIEIVFGGLRPGEKLVEDLHLSGDVRPSRHPRIMHIDEQHLPPEEFGAHFETLRAAVHGEDAVALRSALPRLVEGYPHASGCHDGRRVRRRGQAWSCRYVKGDAMCP